MWGFEPMCRGNDPVVTAETDRIQQHTDPSVQARIARMTEDSAAAAIAEGRVDERLGELQKEWDAERVLFTASGLNALLGLVLGRWVDPRWYVYVAAVAAFQTQHGIQGWCPPLAVIRRFQVRTRTEIETERTTLRAVRGDFDGIGRGSSVPGALAAAAGATDSGHTR